MSLVGWLQINHASRTVWERGAHDSANGIRQASKQVPRPIPSHAQEQRSADQRHRYTGYGDPPTVVDVCHCQAPSKPDGRLPQDPSTVH